MKKIIVYVIISIVTTALATVLVINNLGTSKTASVNLYTIEDAEAAVKQRLEQLNGSLVSQIAGFADAVIADNGFSMKLYGESDRSAQEVVTISGRYLNAMGFAVLKIADSDFLTVSSAHFPASTGNDCKKQIESFQNVPSVSDETIIDHSVLTYQIKKVFSISDYKLYALGGIEINQAFFDKLTPWSKVKVFMKRGNEYKGMDSIRTISEINDNKIIINDKEYFATRIPLTSTEKTMETSLIVVLEK